MKKEYKDFIATISDVYPSGFCEHIISEFDRMQDFGAGFSRQAAENGVPKHKKNDYHIGLNGLNLNFQKFKNLNPISIFFEGLQKCFELYGEEYSILKDVNLVCTNMKIQKTSPGGGYHVWHCEQGNDESCRRCVVYMLYLNELPEEANGETEFLYQEKRIRPTANTMVMWPAGFTHPHRGNPVYGDNHKYVITGWFYYE